MPLSPRESKLEEGGIEMAPSSVCNRQSLKWRKFFLFWIIIAVLTVSGQFCMVKFNDLRDTFLTMVTVFSSTNWVNVAVGVVFLLSLCLMFVMKKPESSHNVYSSLPSVGASSAKLGQTTLQDRRLNSNREFPCRRTFSGQGSDVWCDFRRYFDNLAQLNCWPADHKRRTLLCCLRGQAEGFVYGLPMNIQNDWYSLMTKLESRFGIANMKDRYVADAKLRRKHKNESFYEFGQELEDLFRKAYPDNLDFVQELALTTFLDNCSDFSDFRLSLKRTKPKTLQDAITNAMQEECLRLTERENINKPQKVFGANREDKGRSRNRYQGTRRRESTTKPKGNLN